MSKPLDDIFEVIGAGLSAIAPAAIGAAVAQAWEKGLSWSQRLVQWGVGICVSYYVTGGVSSWLHLDRFIAQAIGFVLAMVAFRATPAFIAGFVAAASTIPGRFLDRVAPGRGDGA
ncbi:hypothetical protein [Sphingomonas sp. PR090111-T3T-6A]|uniref:hypothetical protein n=1 Tax=Sphingomonas sp. PR090111-T3T-6A TaxID=685778 RepID=UPI000372016E|nr:hypothetical protein [Sphingomonas sp. PR090111-T3T-6A]